MSQPLSPVAGNVVLPDAACTPISANAVSGNAIFQDDHSLLMRSVGPEGPTDSPVEVDYFPP